MSRRMAFLHLPPIRWLTSFYNLPQQKSAWKITFAGSRLGRAAFLPSFQTRNFLQQLYY